MGEPPFFRQIAASEGTLYALDRQGRVWVRAWRESLEDYAWVLDGAPVTTMAHIQQAADERARR